MAEQSHSAVEETHAGTVAHGSGEGGGNPLLRPEPGVALWTVIIFIFLLILLKKIAWGPMLDTLDKREKAIRDSLAEAEKARAEAKSTIEEQERLLAEARRQAQDLLAKSRQDAERSREESIARARDESEKIIESGRRAIEQEKQAAIHDIRGSAVDLVIAATSKLLRASIDDAKSRELVRTYVNELDRSSRQRPS